MNAKERWAEIQAQFGKYGEASPEVMQGYGVMSKAAMDTCAPLDPKTMELITVAVAVARKCEPCIFAHVNALIEAGGTREELAAALNTTLLICGGPGLAYSGLALDVFDQLSE